MASPEAPLTEELLRATKDGDAVAEWHVGRWMALEIIRFYRRQGFAVGELGQELRDCAHDAIADVFKKRDRMPVDVDAFRDWTLSFALVEIRERQTKDGRARRKVDALGGEPSPEVRGPDTQLGYYRTLRRVHAEVEKLPTPYRQTFKLVCEHESSKQVATLLGVPAGTVRRQYSIARRWLLEALEASRLTAPEFRTSASS